MTRQSPYVITLSIEDRAVLEGRSRAYTASFATVVRSKIVLLAADGERNVMIAEARIDAHRPADTPTATPAAAHAA